jgi:phage repressor protein C with HTH and peptisase S24 domain
MLEQGRRSPTLGAIFAIAEALACSPSTLIGIVEASAAPRLQHEVVDRAQAQPFKRHLPVYSIEAAAGHFMSNEPAEELGWIASPPGLRPTADMFVVTVRGRSMEPLVPDGAFAVFRAGVAGDRQGRMLLIELLTAEDPELGGAYTVKRWYSEKESAPAEEGGWRHSRIELRSINPEHRPIGISRDQDVRVIAELVRVL